MIRRISPLVFRFHSLFGPRFVRWWLWVVGVDVGALCFTGPNIREHRRICICEPRMNKAAVGKASRKLGDLRIILLPLGDSPRASEFGFFLRTKSVSELKECGRSIL